MLRSVALRLSSSRTVMRELGSGSGSTQRIDGQLTDRAEMGPVA
jgi:hypothetical protein